MNDNPRATAELWQKLKLQTITTAKSLREWVIALLNNRLLQTATKLFCVAVTGYLSIKLLTTIQTLLPIIVIIYLVRMLYKNGYKLENKVSRFLIRHELILAKPVTVEESELIFTQGEKSGQMFWSYKNYTGNYQIVGGNNYQTSIAIITYDQDTFFIKQSLAHEIKDTIEKSIN